MMIKQSNINIPFFSIIVPIYNAEKYLPECIDSVLSQTMQDWELILVDDGSVDRSGIICDEYAQKDGRIKVIHKENGGEFSSRYAAVLAATGEYATGLDADDKYAPNYLTTIEDEIRRGDYDCVKWSLTYFGDLNGVSALPSDSVGVYTGSEYLELAVKSSMCSFCTQAIKLDILRRVDYSGVPPIRMSEDYLMIIPALCYVRNAKVIDFYGYYYRIHGNSASNLINFSKIYDLCEASKYGLAFMKDAGVLNAELVKGEYLTFLRCTWSRIEKALRANVLKDDQIEMIREHESYINAASVESIGEFGFANFIKMKMFRKGHVLIAKCMSEITWAVIKGTTWIKKQFCLL